MQVIETPFSRLTLCDDGILEAHPIDREAPRTASLLLETMDALRRVGGGKPRPVLWDPTETLPLQPGGWRAILDSLQDTISALAIVVPQEEEQLLGSFPETIATLLIPVRTFFEKGEARTWLLRFLEAD